MTTTLATRAARAALSIPLAAIVPATVALGFIVTHVTPAAELGFRVLHRDFRKKAY